MPKTLCKFHILDLFLLLGAKKDVPQNFRFATHPISLGSAPDKENNCEPLPGLGAAAGGEQRFAPHISIVKPQTGMDGTDAAEERGDMAHVFLS